MTFLQKILSGVLLAMIAVAAMQLNHQRARERLGEPGIKTRPTPGKINCDLILPETLTGYTSEILTNSEEILRTFLPTDSSFQVRQYHATDGFSVELSVVLMGRDRTSIHKPEICMPSQGWEIDHQLTDVQLISMGTPFAYILPVNRIVSSKVLQDASGRSQNLKGICVYWFVDGTRYTEKSWKWKVWYIPRDLVLNGVLERWSYISLFSSCLPGQEEATFQRMKKFILTAVPQFQLVPRQGS